jgi:hypothetical protein
MKLTLLLLTIVVLIGAFIAQATPQIGFKFNSDFHASFNTKLQNWATITKDNTIAIGQNINFLFYVFGPQSLQNIQNIQVSLVANPDTAEEIELVKLSTSADLNVRVVIQETATAGEEEQYNMDLYIPESWPTSPQGPIGTPHTHAYLKLVFPAISTSSELTLYSPRSFPLVKYGLGLYPQDSSEYYFDDCSQDVEVVQQTVCMITEPASLRSPSTHYGFCNSVSITPASSSITLSPPANCAEQAPIVSELFFGYISSDGKYIANSRVLPLGREFVGTWKPTKFFDIDNTSITGKLTLLGVSEDGLKESVISIWDNISIFSPFAFELRDEFVPGVYYSGVEISGLSLSTLEDSPDNGAPIPHPKVYFRLDYSVNGIEYTTTNRDNTYDNKYMAIVDFRATDLAVCQQDSRWAECKDFVSTSEDWDCMGVAPAEYIGPIDYNLYDFACPYSDNDISCSPLCQLSTPPLTQVTLDTLLEADNAILVGSNSHTISYSWDHEVSNVAGTFQLVKINPDQTETILAEFYKPLTPLPQFRIDTQAATAHSFEFELPEGITAHAKVTVRILYTLNGHQYSSQTDTFAIIRTAWEVYPISCDGLLDNVICGEITAPQAQTCMITEPAELSGPSKGAADSCIEVKPAEPEQTQLTCTIPQIDGCKNDGKCVNNACKCGVDWTGDRCEIDNTEDPTTDPEEHTTDPETGGKNSAQSITHVLVVVVAAFFIALC